MGDTLGSLSYFQKEVAYALGGLPCVGNPNCVYSRSAHTAHAGEPGVRKVQDQPQDGLQVAEALRPAARIAPGGSVATTRDLAQKNSQGFGASDPRRAGALPLG